MAGSTTWRPGSRSSGPARRQSRPTTSRSPGATPWRTSRSQRAAGCPAPTWPRPSRSTSRRSTWCSMPSAQTQPAPVAATGARVTLVDTDIHPMMLGPALEARLSERWWRHYEDFGVRVAAPPAIYPRVRNAGYRTDAWPEGGFPGSDLELLRRQLLDEHDVQYGTLNPLQGQVWGAEAPELAAVLCRALNDWIAEEWLYAEPRLLGSICVPFEHPELAVRQIERRAGDRRFVQVLLAASTEAPLGNRRYRPIYAAAEEAGLPVAIHTGGIE